MGQNQPTIRLPFEYVQGIPRTTAIQIHRDFTEVINHITPTPSVFDALIDPALSASSPSTHQYVNLTDLLANETWTTTLNVAVHQRKDLPITEPGTPSLASTASQGDLALFGFAYSPPAGGLFEGWKWRGLGMTGLHIVYYTNLTLDPNLAAQSLQTGGTAIMHGCVIGSNFTSLNTLGSSAGAGDTECYDCNFVSNTIACTGGGGSQINIYLFGCKMDSTTWTVGNTGTLKAHGCGGNGVWSITQASNGNISISGSRAIQLNITGNGGNVVVHSVDGSSVTCAATAVVTELTGNWNTVSMTNAPTTNRSFQGIADTMDFTGPGTVDAYITNPTGANHLKLRGDAVKANITLMQSSLQAIGLTNSEVTCEFVNNGFYTFDVATHNNLFIFGGTHTATFLPGSVSLGTGVLNRVITEDADSLLGGTPVATTNFNQVFMLGGM